jgi:hypothetical protein
MTDFATAEIRLWTLHRLGRTAAASIHPHIFGRELHVTVGAHTILKRLLKDHETNDRVSAELLRLFLAEGWQQFREHEH